ncbi:MAG: heat-inducible transcription repressor HrcA [Nitrospirae bacterium]|nr:heat-inducible transcription repressor HrcA [Nitrospirota bacterium]
MDNLSERNKKILWAIIQSYTTLNVPVGSSRVTRSFSFGLSSATIRNIMASLENMGYVKQPHTSAGRIPTENGYRLYVNSLLMRNKLSINKNLYEKLTLRLLNIQHDVTQLVKEAAKILSLYSKYLSIATNSRTDELTITNIKLINYEEYKALCILIANDGSVRSRFLHLVSPLSQNDLDALSGYLNNLINGLSFSNAEKLLSLKILDEQARNVHIENILQSCKDFIKNEADNLTTNEFAGTSYLPDFASLKQIKEILTAVEKRYLFLNIMHNLKDSKGVQVFIGIDNIMPAMKGLSLIASTYKNGRELHGAIGVIGPTSMDYKKLIPIVEHTANTMTKILSNA